MQEFRKVHHVADIFQEYMVFSNISELHKYVNETPANKTFEIYERQSRYTDGYYQAFALTSDFDEACSLLKNGWDEGAKDLDQKVESYFKGAKIASQSQQTKRKSVYDVAGYQVSVPRYLNGVPNSMVRTQMVPVKNKIITINKVMGYTGDITTEKIMNESAKALAIIKRIEDMGYRVNLNVVNLSYDHYQSMVGLKVRIKNANERLNISKVAFPMCHPGMMRRIIFGFKEVFPDVSSTFGRSYGQSSSSIRDFSNMCKGEYVIPPFISESIVNAKELNIEQFKV